MQSPEEQLLDSDTARDVLRAVVADGARHIEKPTFRD